MKEEVRQYRRLIQARIELCRWKAHALYLERERTDPCWEDHRATLTHRIKVLRKAEAKLVALRASVLHRDMSGDIINFEPNPDLGALNAPLALALNDALTGAPLDILVMERERPGTISKELPALLGRALSEAASNASNRDEFVASLAAYVAMARNHETERMALLIERGLRDASFLASFVYLGPNAAGSWV